MLLLTLNPELRGERTDGDILGEWTALEPRGPVSTPDSLGRTEAGALSTVLEWDRGSGANQRTDEHDSVRFPLTDFLKNVFAYRGAESGLGWGCG